MIAFDLYVDQQGRMRCLYSEAIDLSALGELSVSRASHVEPDEHGRWWADLSPAAGPLLGPYPLRSAALEAESEWLSRHLLPPPG